MPLDYRLISGLPAPQLDTFQQIQGFGQAAEEDRQQQQAKIDARVMQQVLQENIDNPDNAVMALKRKGMFGAATKLETHITEMKQKTAAARKTELEAAKIDLENKGAHPDQKSKQIETELKLIAARDPKLVLEGIANSQSQQDLDHWLGAAKFLLPKESEAIIATLPTVWTPDVPKWAARQAIGAKEVANNALQERGQDMTAATAASGQETTRRGQDITAATAAAGQALTRRGQDLVNQRATTGGGVSTPATKALAQTVFKNPALYAGMTATNKDRIAADLSELGFDFAKYGGHAPDGAGGAKLSATAIEKVAGFDQSLGMLDDIEALLPKMSGNIGIMDGRLANAKLATGAGISEDLAKFAAQLTGLKNAVIKATTGAAMSEPEAKRIMGQLPDLTQPEAVFKARLETTRKNMELLKRRTIELSGGSVAPAAPKALTAEELIKKYGGG